MPLKSTTENTPDTPSESSPKTTAEEATNEAPSITADIKDTSATTDAMTSTVVGTTNYNLQDGYDEDA